MATALRRDPITQLGEFLRAARERAGLTIEQVSSSTKIPPRHLDAIEHGDISVVPKGPYRRGEVRAFAEAVGLDQNVALAQLNEALPQAPVELAPVPVEPIEPGSSWGVTLLLLIAIGALTTLLLWNRDAASTVRVEPAAAPAPSSTATTPTQTSEAAPETPASPQPPAAVAATAPDPSPVATVSPVLIVTSVPSGARVVVDGIGRGTTPARIEYLSLGEKTVRLVHDGYVSEERSVSLTPKRPAVTLHLELRPK